MKTIDYLNEPIVFLGFGRCGSTIISEVILQHHKLAWVSNYQEKFPSSSKINLIRNIFYNCFWRCKGKKDQLNSVPLLNKYIFRPAESYQFWNSITGRNLSHSFLFEVEELSRKRDKIRSFFVNLVRYQNRSRLAFKITGPSRLIYLNSIFPDAKFIWIQRNPLPNIRSLLKVDYYQSGKNELWWEGVYSEKEKKKVNNWKDKNPAFTAALQLYKVNEIFDKEKNKIDSENRILKIDYENFVENPEGTVNEILEFTELKWDKRMLKYLDENKIYDRNKCEEYFIGPEIDTKVLEIVNNGID